MIEISEIPAKYRVDLGLEYDRAVEWLACDALFIDLVQEVDEMNMYFVSKTVDDAKKAVSILDLIKSMTVTINQELLPEGSLSEGVLCDDFLARVKSSIFYNNLSKRNFIDLQENLSHLFIPTELLSILKEQNLINAS